MTAALKNFKTNAGVIPEPLARKAFGAQERIVLRVYHQRGYGDGLDKTNGAQLWEFQTDAESTRR